MAWKFSPISRDLTWYEKSGTNFEFYRIQLDEAAISTKTITMPFSVIPDTPVTLIPEGGPPQIEDIDFDASGNIITWGGKGLDGFLEIGDYITITAFVE
jgi:hypothetical protein